MRARSPRDAPPLAPSPRAVTTWSCHEAARDGALEHDAGMTHLFHTRGNVENEGAVADVDIARHFVRHPIVTSHEKGADRLVVLKRHQPVRVLPSRPGFPEFGELPVPGRIRHLHRKLVGELTLAIFRVTTAGDRPSFGVFGTGDDADANAPGRDVRRRGAR